MGCFSSRDQKRSDAQSGDFNVVPFNFVVADAATPDGFAPLDKLAIKLCGEGKDFKDKVGDIADMKMAADKAKELAVKIHAALKAKHAEISKMDLEKGKSSDVNCKYSPKEALADIEGCLTKLSEKSGIEEVKWAPETKGDDKMMMGGDMMEMMMEGEAMAGADMEGGEEMVMEAAVDAGADAGAAAMSFFDEEKFGSSEGPELLPKLLLECLVLYPYVGDLVRSQVVAHELGGGKGEEWAELSTIISAAVEAGEKAEVDIYMGAWLGPDDKEDFDDVVKNKETKALVFPGVVCGYSSEEDALKKAKDKTESNQKVEKYLFHVKTNAFKACGDKIHAVHRLFAKVTSAAKAEGKDFTLVELTLFADHATKTMAEFAEKIAAAKAVVAEVKDKVDDKMMMDDMMMMEPPKEDMMEPPMEGA